MSTEHFNTKSKTEPTPPKRLEAAATLNDAATKVAAASSRFCKAEDVIVGYFDPNEPICDLASALPHWRQEAVTYFVTFRLADSLPQDKLRRWASERDLWIKANPGPHSPIQRVDYHRLFTARFHYWLDQGYGSCALARPDANQIVENAMRYFVGQRYALDEFIIMPNHVHALLTPLSGYELSAILHSWKSFTANQINRVLGISGAFWQKESFDHIVRSPESMERFRRYIRENPKLQKVAAASSC